MSNSKIDIISKSTVTIPPQAEPTSQINLTPWDLELLFLKYSQKGLLFLKPSPQTEPITSLIQRLKQSLEQTLHFFPPLAGRLASAAESRRFSIDCSPAGGGGALFVHAAADLSVADILRPAYVPAAVRSFFPLAGACNIDGVSLPLLAAQVTELADGIFVGLSINHLLADGTSFWHFLSSWAEISRGGPVVRLSKPPSLDRGRLTLDLTGSAGVDISDALHLLDESPEPPPPKPSFLRERIFRFSKRAVAGLREKAGREAAGIKISSLQAVVAHVWRSAIRCRFGGKSPAARGTTTSFEIPIGARGRLDPPLPEGYFGNAIFPGIVTLKIDDVLENGLGWTAAEINKMVGSFNGPSKVKEVYMDWIKRPNLQRLDRLPENYFMLINSPRFDVYSNDFGWGRPVAVRGGAANAFDGRITISRGLEEGSVEIEACLAAETLTGLEEDKEFLEYVDS
ncbi:HXXXD-type acyl-transferase family protein [Striga asiatica]|uniref:HXXXD-type acyl-transferase family protein n=1 Tax=Striga asiatica TaxID=4170 RepID=A0A5A7NX22_STRAF|nr:HXXXD-type acyl-transferase family protein [Striga asiatica]